MCLPLYFVFTVPGQVAAYYIMSSDLFATTFLAPTATFCSVFMYVNGLASMAWLTYLLLADPGFVPQPAQEHSSAPPKHLSPHAVNLAALGIIEGEIPDDGIYTYYCPVCKLYVSRYDHHCGIVGACIGKKNMAAFISFLFHAWLQCYVGGICCLVHCYALFVPMIKNRANLPSADSVASWHFFTTYLLPPMFTMLGMYLGAYCLILWGNYIYQVWNNNDAHVLRRGRARYGKREFKGDHLGCWGNFKRCYGNLELANTYTVVSALRPPVGKSTESPV